MSLASIFKRSRGLAREFALALILLFLGSAAMPMLIFYTGANVLGRYEGASLPGFYSSIFDGLQKGTASAWIVVLGPYGLYIAFRLLAAGWRASGLRPRPSRR